MRLQGQHRAIATGIWCQLQPGPNGVRSSSKLSACPRAPDSAISRGAGSPAVTLSTRPPRAVQPPADGRPCAADRHQRDRAAAIIVLLLPPTAERTDKGGGGGRRSDSAGRSCPKVQRCDRAQRFGVGSGVLHGSRTKRQLAAEAAVIFRSRGRCRLVERWACVSR